MELEHPTLEPFEPVLRREINIAHTGGLSQLEKKGLRFADTDQLRDLLLNPTVFRLFIRGCHYGFDLAQHHVAGLVIDLESQIRHATNAFKEFRNRHDEQARDALETLRILQDRQIVLRRLIDSILYTIVGAKTWVIRRFLQEYRIRPINPETLGTTVEFASCLNRQERMSFNLVADLTTVVQIGDLISIEIAELGRAKWTIVELKEGRMNEILSGIIEGSHGSITSDDRQLIKTALGDHALKQAQRMMRQRSRMTEVVRILTTDEGIDLGLNRQIHLTPDPVELDNCHDAVQSVCRRAKDSGVGVAVVDGCLRFVAVSNAQMKALGHLGVAHSFYHLSGKNKVCSLSDPEQRDDEIKALKSVPVFVDLVEHNMKSQLGCPLFVWKDKEAVLDLLSGRIRLFAQFDVESFFELAAEENIKMTWVKGREAEELKGISRQIPGSPKAWGIRAELPDGTDQVLLLGFIGRAIVDLTPPRELLRMVKRVPDQIAKMKGPPP
jgi:hypothetical protein